MKSTFLALIVLLVFDAESAGAHLFAPPTLETLGHSDVIYLAEVSPTLNTGQPPPPGKIAFRLLEAVRNDVPVLDPPPFLILTPYMGDFEADSQWLLIHNETGFKGCVGWAIKGDCEWWPCKVTSVNGKKMVQWLGPLDDIRKYLRTHPSKPN